jgi:hypothetical protein
MFSYGVFVSFDSGWLSANADTVWGYGMPCTSDSQCPEGDRCVNGGCTGGQTTTTGQFDARSSSFNFDDGKDLQSGRGGCSCGAGETAEAAWMLALLRRRCLLARR